MKSILINLPYIIRFIRFLLTIDRIRTIKSEPLREIAHLLTGSKQYYKFDQIEKLRNQLKSNNDTIRVTDFGAGTMQTSGKVRKISYIARTSGSSKQQCQGMFRLADHIQAKTILELGTSLGISTAYLAASNDTINVQTIEGDPEIARLAKMNFKKLNAANIRLTVGNFNDKLEPTLQLCDQLDLAFIDGNHQKTPTLSYYNQIITHCSSKAVIIIDDIYWSKDMRDAWLLIRSGPEVKASLDLFTHGIIFLSDELDGHYQIFKPELF